MYQYPSVRQRLINVYMFSNAADEEERGCKRLLERKGCWDLSSTRSRDHLGCSGEMAFGTNRRSAPVMAVLSGLITANKGGTAVNPVPLLG